MHAGERSDDLEMTEFLGPDIHQQIFPIWVFAVESLDRILHRGGELAVCSAELFQKHIAEAHVGLVDAYSEHEFFDMMIHGRPLRERILPQSRLPPCVPKKLQALQNNRLIAANAARDQVASCFL